MQSFLRTVLATFAAFLLAILVDYLFSGLATSELGIGRYLLVNLFYGFPIICIGVAIFCVVNYSTHLRIRRAQYKNIHLFYFALSISAGLVPVLGFTIFDWLDRGRYFDDPTFQSFFREYLPMVFLTALAALTNWIIVWNLFARKT